MNNNGEKIGKKHKERSIYYDSLKKRRIMDINRDLGVHLDRGFTRRLGLIIERSPADGSGICLFDGSTTSDYTYSSTGNPSGQAHSVYINRGTSLDLNLDLDLDLGRSRALIIDHNRIPHRGTTNGYNSSTGNASSHARSRHITTNNINGEDLAVNSQVCLRPNQGGSSTRTNHINDLPAFRFPPVPPPLPAWNARNTIPGFCCVGTTIGYSMDHLAESSSDSN